MKHKMIIGQTLYSFFHEGRHDLHIREVRLLNRDLKGGVNGTTRLLYDEEAGALKRYVNGSAPIASLSDDMVCFLAEVSRCFGRLSPEMSWEEDVWLCVDTEVLPDRIGQTVPASGGESESAEWVDMPVLPGPDTCDQVAAYRVGI